MIDSNKPVDLVYLDFSKAFDKVAHEFLLQKLRAIGITGNLLTWITNWLSNRRQRVVINGKFSDWDSVLSGVPQGSVLGVILFLIFVWDISNGSSLIAPHSIFSTFADDTKLAQTVESPEGIRQLQQLLDNLAEWSKKWAMPFNVKKCTVMHLGNRNPHQAYNIDGQVLDATTVQRDLGVQIHESLKPATHITYATKKAQKILALIKRTISYKSREVMVRLYKSHVRCHLEYASSVWRPWLIKDINKLENIQRRFVKMVQGVAGNSYEEKLKDLGLTTIQARHERTDMIQTFKIRNSLDRIDTSDSISTQSHSYSTRGSTRNNLQINHTNRDLRKYFFTERIKSSWNSLSSETREAPSIDSFKKRYDLEVSTQRV